MFCTANTTLVLRGWLFFVNKSTTVLNSSIRSSIIIKSPFFGQSFYELHVHFFVRALPFGIAPDHFTRAGRNQIGSEQFCKEMKFYLQTMSQTWTLRSVLQDIAIYVKENKGEGIHCVSPLVGVVVAVWGTAVHWSLCVSFKYFVTMLCTTRVGDVWDCRCHTDCLRHMWASALLLCM